MKKNRRGKVVFAAIVVLSALALVLPAYAANEDVLVGITPLRVMPGDTAIVPLTVSNVTDLGAGTLSVTYNASVCTVTDVTSNSFIVVKNISVPGLAILSGISFSGHTGNVTFANLEIRAAGRCGESSPLNIAVETLYVYGPPPERIPAANIRVRNGTFTIVRAPGVTPVFDTGPGTYPSISGRHNGTLTPGKTISVCKMYTYTYLETRGHSKYVRIWNESGTIAEGRWSGYGGDWHNISFDTLFILRANESYRYTIRTDSYPQMIHKQNHKTPDGSLITCSEFIDAVGTRHDDWIPAITLFQPAPLDTGPGTYPSAPGTHKGTITPCYDVFVRKMYTYPCPGTLGHSEYVRIFNESGIIAEGLWTGYGSDWHNISFDPPFILKANKSYQYTILTSSYPQIIHAHRVNVPGGTFTCDEFIDVDGKRHDDWIPAITFFF